MAFFRTVTSKGKDYLQYVHSYRDKKGQSLKKVLASLGNISDKSEEDIEKMAKSFLRALGMEDKFQMNKFTTGKGYHYGLCLPVIGVWNQLGLDRIIGRYLSSKVKIPVSRISLIQVANRFSSPSSKLACYRWYDRSLFSQMKNFIHFPDDKKEKVHTYYRSLDYLCSIKEKMEEELYYRLKGYGLDNSLVLYDITSIFFERNEAQREPGMDIVVIIDQMPGRL